MSSSELGVNECISLGFSNFELGDLILNMRTPKLLHSVTPNSELLIIEQFVLLSTSISILLQ